MKQMQKIRVVAQTPGKRQKNFENGYHWVQITSYKKKNQQTNKNKSLYKILKFFIV